MFQFLISADKPKEEWITTIMDFLRQNLPSDCLIATTKTGGRCQLAIASETEERNLIIKIIADCIIEALGYFCKYKYLSDNLKLPLDADRYNILLHSLVQFDRSSDEKMLKSCVQISDGMALDGIYNFRLSELKRRWDEIIMLTKENSIYLIDNETYFELINFLFTSIEAKVKNVVLAKRGENYVITNENDSKLLFSSRDVKEIVYKLIDYAPLSIAVNRSFENEKTIELITRLFGMRQSEIS